MTGVRGGSRPGAGRPPTGNTEALLLRLSPELLARVKAAAEARGVTVSDFARKALLRAARRP